jgi:hypothetical protein
MARTRSDRLIERRTLTFTLPNGTEATIEARMGPTREWYDSPESKEPGWHPIEGDGPGRVLALRLVV